MAVNKKLTNAGRTSWTNDLCEYVERKRVRQLTRHDSRTCRLPPPRGSAWCSLEGVEVGVGGAEGG